MNVPKLILPTVCDGTNRKAALQGYMTDSLSTTVFTIQQAIEQVVTLSISKKLNRKLNLQAFAGFQPT